MWQEIVQGPAEKLAANLQGDDGSVEGAEALLESYLELAAEGVGLGYLYPVESAGRRSFLHLAWFELLPEQLPRLEPEQQVDVLAACWNLGENLEQRSGWLQRLFMEEVETLDSLVDLEGRIEEIASSLLGTPDGRLEGETPGSVRLRRLYTGDQHPRFLPGVIEFLAPGIACVHHRHADLDGAPKKSLGISLLGDPELLGTVKASNPSLSPDPEEDDWWKPIAEGTPAVTRPHAAAANEWRGILTMETSQFVVVVEPGRSESEEREDRVVLGLE